MAMRNPPHPGEILKELYIRPLGLKQKDMAAGMGITKKALSELLNGHTSLSTLMALRLAEAFDTTPEFWLQLQQHYDLYKAQLAFEGHPIHHYRPRTQSLSMT